MTDVELHNFAKVIPHFRGVFMRNNLPKRPHKLECGIVNLDDREGPGTHWCAYRKKGDAAMWYDSFGNLPPPREILNYLKGQQIIYNYDREQNFGTWNCGHLCLEFLLKTSGTSI